MAMLATQDVSIGGFVANEDLPEALGRQTEDEHAVGEPRLAQLPADRSSPVGLEDLLEMKLWVPGLRRDSRRQESRILPSTVNQLYHTPNA